MTGITYFVALPFDVADGSVVVGEPIECLVVLSRLQTCGGPDDGALCFGAKAGDVP
jgi:hypothetical protein